MQPVPGTTDAASPARRKTHHCGREPMRTFVWLAAASLTLCVAASPVSARVVRMETKGALEDQSQPSIRQAPLQAFPTSVPGAIALGVSPVGVAGAPFLPDPRGPPMGATRE